MRPVEIVAIPGVAGLELLSILVGLLLLAAIILIGRFILHVAWRLVLIALVVLGGLYLVLLFAPGVI